MGHFPHSIKTHTHTHLLLSLLLLLGSIQFRYSAEGRPLVKLLGVAEEGEGEEMVMEGAMIGSRPPMCKGRCNSCGHCEAVQVPTDPQERRRVGNFSTTITARGDDSSNYKPMNWKCKCGHLILNP